MTEAEYLAGPAACLVKDGEEEMVPLPGAGIQDHLHLDGQDPQQLLRCLQRDHPPAIGLVLAADAFPTPGTGPRRQDNRSVRVEDHSSSC